MEDQEPPQDQAIQFARTPGLVNGRIINYETTEGLKLFKNATAELKSDYDLSPEGLNVFLKETDDRAHAYGWTHILNIPPDLGNPDRLVNLISDYGQLSLEQVQAHAETYINTRSRASQDSTQLYYCIMATLTKEAKDTVLLVEHEYRLTAHNTESGTALLKAIIREASVDTNATVRSIRNRLSNLDDKMLELKSDIPEFNKYVMAQIKALHARGMDSEDLIANLFKGYKVAADKEFYDFIKRKEQEYDEGVSTDILTPELLMNMAKNKYSNLKQFDVWMAPSEQDQKIIALETQVKQLAKKTNKQSGKSQDKSPVKKQNTTNPKGNTTGRRRNKKPDWMLKHPKSGEPHKKVVKGKTYNWCRHHQSWGIHIEGDCEVGKEKTKQEAKKNKADKAKDESNPQLRLAKALQAIADGSDDDL